MPKTSKVKVSTADTELEFNMLNKSVGKALFDQVVNTTGIREVGAIFTLLHHLHRLDKFIIAFKVWYFGLHYLNVRQQSSWLNLETKVLQQEVKKEALPKFEFKFKFFPENVADEVIQDVTLKLLFLQV